jgi:tRNA/tmRNA/rRNA uracil-C5-methylase (TrmA/RlmC/RlmD family)
MPADEDAVHQDDPFVLPGYEALLTGENAILHSKRKLNVAKRNLRSLFKDQKYHESSVLSLPCTTEEETLRYRCKCSFQCIQDNDKQYQYAMRHKGEPVVIASCKFPIANERIQRAMQELWKHVLNPRQGDASFPNLVNQSLTSLTFAASWGGGDSDCIVTLNYDSALESKDNKWQEEAQKVCQILNLKQLNGRSRKRFLAATKSGVPSPLGNFLRDTIYLTPPSGEGCAWRVSLVRPPSQDDCRIIPVHYHKPVEAFFHPNANVMCQALAWMLNRIALIVSATSLGPVNSNQRCLLEMYCGCGAHTMALAKSSLLSSILAVELDQRLVDACNINIHLNDSTVASGGILSSIQVVRGHAGQWAREAKTRTTTRVSSHDHDYQILLVDPPRQGLDEQVINLAIHTASVHDMLIVSCGHEALVRDLKVLSKHFDIIDCTQLDLFPRTDSVETLVHLKRRR